VVAVAVASSLVLTAGTGAISGSGRVDLRLAVDRSGELSLLSKSDGVIRAVTGASPATPPATATRVR
jgi:hypothetical protein